MISLPVTGQRVREQYERFPYPDINLQQDQPRLLVSGHLGLMCDVLWGGKKTPHGLRVLDAGCGTGGAAVAMALNFPEAHITGVDFSQASIHKASALAQKYGVRNIRFIHLPIEHLTRLGETFDFISSSGVLHHLADPAAGLKAIGDVLDPRGAVSIMLYGKYGRSGVYMLQQALKLMAGPGESVKNEESGTLTGDYIRFAHHLANQTPPHHPMSNRPLGREMQEGKDAGIVDLLLHANDIPFDVPAVYRLCKDAGMRFHRWLIPLIYNVENFLNQPVLMDRLKEAGLNPAQQQEMAELAHGRNSKHSFFAVRPEFKPHLTTFENGKWRGMYAKLTPCLAWNRAARVPGKAATFAVPFTIIQDAWGPLEISRWEMVFLSKVTPEKSLQKVLDDLLADPQLQTNIPFNSPEEIDEAVETLLNKAHERLAIVFRHIDDGALGE